MYDYDVTKPRTFAEFVEMDRAALAAGPVARFPDGSPVFVRYADVWELLNHPDARLGYVNSLERDGIPQSRVLDISRNFLTGVEIPDHTRLRSLVSRAFAVRPMERMRSVARKAVGEALDGLPLGGEFDLYEDLATRVPLRVMCSLLGIPDEYWRELRSFLAAVTPALVNVNGTAECQHRAEAALERLFAFVDEFVEEKLARPEEDLISLLASAEQAGGLSHIELQSMITFLLLAGNDTTRGLIGLGTFLLTEHPEQLELLQADPERATGAVEEMLRFSAPATWLMRVATKTIERAGVKLEPGQPFILALGTANRDTDHFSHADRFDILRRGEQHLVFGRGRHFCLGAALARLEGQEVFRALAQRPFKLARLGADPLWTRASSLMNPVGPIRLRRQPPEQPLRARAVGAV